MKSNHIILAMILLNIDCSHLIAGTNIINLSRTQDKIVLESAAGLRDERGFSDQSDFTVRLGQGYNSIGGLEFSQDLGYCVEKGSLETFGNSPGESLSIYVDNISSSEEFSSTLMTTHDFGAGFSMSSPGKKEGEKINFLSASAQAKGKNSTLRKYESRYNYVYVQVRKNFEAEMLAKFEIPASNLTYFSARPNEFFSKCGDKFVSGVKKGSEVIGVLRCEAISSEQKVNLDGMIKASAGYKAFTAQGEVTNLLEQIKKTTNNNCQMIVTAQGGNGTYDIKDSANFIASAINYVSGATLTTAKPLEYITTAYSAVINLDFSANVLDKIDLNLKSQRDFVESKKVQIDINLDMLEILSRSGNANLVASNLAASQIEKFAQQIASCVKDVYNEAACKDPSSAFRLPPGAILRPSRP